MKLLTIALPVLLLAGTLNAQAIFSRNGYPEHFIAGTVAGATVSYLSYKKTHDKLKSWILGFTAATVVGGVKELIDPVLLGRNRSTLDFVYTSLGGVLGASIVIPLRGSSRRSVNVRDKPPALF